MMNKDEYNIQPLKADPLLAGLSVIFKNINMPLPVFIPALYLSPIFFSCYFLLTHAPPFF